MGIIIDQEGICSGCKIHKEKDNLDWGKRWTLLEKIVEPYRGKSDYDCIIPVSGGQDSYYIVDVVKNKLGMKPLLVSYNKYFNTPLGIKNLSNLRQQFNLDLVQQNINPLLVKSTIKLTLRRFGSIYWPILAGQTVFPVQSSIRLKIPLIIWGAHQGIEQVGMFSHEHEVEMTRRYRKDHDLMGVEADDIPTIFDSISADELWQFRYPDDDSINLNSTRGIYLGNYIRWDPKNQHEEMINKFGYLTSKFSRTFDCYDYVDCFNYMNLHDYLKLCKHGYSKVTDHASREIRHGRLSRDEAIYLVKKYETNQPEYVDLFCNWLGISEQSLNFVIDQHKNPKFWQKMGKGKWKFKGLSNNFVTKQKVKGVNVQFKTNSKLEYNQNSNYITIGKGYP